MVITISFAVVDGSVVVADAVVVILDDVGARVVVVARIANKLCWDSSSTF